MADPQTAASRRNRYKATSSGYYSFVMDRDTGKTMSHGYDIHADAEISAELWNKEWRAELKRREKETQNG